MASSFSGLFRTLAWTDFPTRQGNAPSPGQPATAAYTHSSFSFTGPSVQPIAGSRPAQFQLMDDLTMSATFDRNKSFVMSWVFSRPLQFQNDMLNHEQGHYNINALVCRDFFIDVMLLKLQTFAAHQAVNATVQQIKTQSLDKISNIHLLYDNEVHLEQRSGQSRGPIQQNWDRLIQTAFTQVRSTGTQAVGGVQHKVRLIDVLTQNGKRI